MRDGAGGEERLADEEPARAGLDRDVDLLAGEALRPVADGGGGGGDAARRTSPVTRLRASKVIWVL
jgi:hypothetical protein